MGARRGEEGCSTSNKERTRVVTSLLQISGKSLGVP